jgi:DinB superfamily
MNAARQHPDIQGLDDAFIAAERDARALTAGLSEEKGAWRRAPSSWSVAQCLDHLATANRVYLHAMHPPAARALASERRRRGPALPGVIGRWFVRTLEPPAKARFKTQAPRSIQPRQSPPLSDAMRAFVESQNEVRSFLRTYADIDLAGVRFPNPFIRGVRFSLATGLHVIAAHERRHLWQAWQVREALERTFGALGAGDSSAPLG